MKHGFQVAASVVSAILINWLAVQAWVISRGQDLQQQPPKAQEGLRHWRIATETGSLALGTNSAGTSLRIKGGTGFMTFPPGAMWQPGQSALNQPVLGRDIDAAEWINARAMNEWQRRFELHLQNPRAVPVPVLYPGQVSRMLENVK